MWENNSFIDVLSFGLFVGIGAFGLFGAVAGGKKSYWSWNVVGCVL